MTAACRFLDGNDDSDDDSSGLMAQYMAETAGRPPRNAYMEGPAYILSKVRTSVLLQILSQTSRGLACPHGTHISSFAAIYSAGLCSASRQSSACACALHICCTLLQVRQTHSLGQQDMTLGKLESQLSYLSCPRRYPLLVFQMQLELHACMPHVGKSLSSQLDTEVPGNDAGLPSSKLQIAV